MIKIRKPKQKILSKFKKEGLPAALDLLLSFYPKGLPFNTEFYGDLPEGVLDGVLAEVIAGRLMLFGRDQNESISRLQGIKNGSSPKQKPAVVKKQTGLLVEHPNPPKLRSKNAQKRQRKKEREVERIRLERQSKQDQKNHYTAKSLDIHESGICPSNPKTWFSTNKRRVTIFCGPTNSGKTYCALEMLKQSSGVYLAPLRLMALEQYDILKVVGATELVTGEEHLCSRPGATALFVSATIEAVSLDTHYETVVIDEAQMMFDEERGWAWTQAIMGVCADNLASARLRTRFPFFLRCFEIKARRPRLFKKNA